jgi:putative addiction module killer protein
MELLRYQKESGREPFTEWLSTLRDRQIRARILARLERIEAGNFGDCKPCRNGVSELRIDAGPGFRIYYARIGNSVVLLLAGGDKRTQDTDIARAVVYLLDFKRRQP